MREVPFGNDGNFSRERMIIVINSELANNIGNLVQRTLSMVIKNCDGKVPSSDGIEKDELDMSFLYKIYVTESNTPQDIEKRYMNCEFNDIMMDIIAIASEANNYIDTKAPWKQKKDDIRLMNATLYHLLEAIRCIAIMIQPFIPDSSSKILDLLTIPQEKRGFSCLSTDYSLVPGISILPPEPVFPRFMEKEA
jgi:methionyl-tRNA synthetase